MPEHQPSFSQYIIFIMVLLPLLYFRLRKLLKPQALKLSQLWIRPAILIAAAAFVLVIPVPGRVPLSQTDMLWLALAAALGAVVGWQWGRLTKLHLHPKNGTLMQTGSMAGMIGFLVLVLLRLGLRTVLGVQASAWHINVWLITDAFIVSWAILFSVRGLEIFLRARKIMAAAIPAAFD